MEHGKCWWCGNPTKYSLCSTECLKAHNAEMAKRDYANPEEMYRWRRAAAMTANHNDDAFMSQFAMRIEKHAIIGNSSLYATDTDGAEYVYDSAMHMWGPAR